MPETRLIALGDIAIAKHRLRGLQENEAWAKWLTALTAKVPAKVIASRGAVR
jgi:hypothetical protein